MATTEVRTTSDAPSLPGGVGPFRTPAIGVGLALIALPLLSDLFAIVRGSHSWLIQRLPDDGFYYLEIAQRLARGSGFTFDGTFETNGIHPLWQLGLVPLARVFGHGDVGIRADLILGLLLFTAALAITIRVIWRAAGPGPALVGGAVAVHGSSAISARVNGMESAAVLVVLALLVVSLDRFARQPDPRRAAIAGLCCTGVVLARFDFAAVVVVVPVAMYVRTRSVRLVAWWLAGAAAIGVPFAVAWFARFGHFLTTSAEVKNAEVSRLIRNRFGGRLTTGYARFLANHLVSYGRNVVASLVDNPFSGPIRAAGAAFVAAIGALGAAVAVRVRLRTPRSHLAPGSWALTVSVTVIALKLVLDVVVAPLWAQVWYSSPQRVAAGLILGGLLWSGIVAVSRWQRGVGAVAAVAAVVLMIPLSIPDALTSADHSTQPASWSGANDLAAAWIRAHGPNARYGARDAGVLGYELDEHRTVVNLDGLVNDYPFAELVKSSTSVWRRARARGVGVFVGRLYDFDRPIPSCARELWRSRPVKTSGNVSPVYIIDLRACPGASASSR